MATNDHVVAKAARVAVKVVTGQVVRDVLVVYEDDTHDIAILAARGLAVQPIPIGDSDQLEVGESVLAIGNPNPDPKITHAPSAWATRS